MKRDPEWPQLKRKEHTVYWCRQTCNVLALKKITNGEYVLSSSLIQAKGCSIPEVVE